MRRLPGIDGFTLLEALAAVITLGLLAAAAVPMLRQLGRVDLPERMEAQYALRMLVPQLDPATATGQTIAGHQDWRLEISGLVAGPEPPPPDGSLPPCGPPHRWVVVAIRSADGATLAETVVALVATAVQP